MFNRDPALYLPLGAAWILAQKAVSGSEFDHAGLVVRVRGDNMLLEETFSGPKLRPFDERIVCSKARQILSRQLAQPLTEPQCRMLELEALRAVEGTPGWGKESSSSLSSILSFDRSGMAPLGMAARLFGGLLGDGLEGARRELQRGSIGAVERGLDAARVGGGGGGGGYGGGRKGVAGRLHPAGLVRNSVVAPGVHLGPRVWWRDLS